MVSADFRKFITRGITMSNFLYTYTLPLRTLRDIVRYSNQTSQLHEPYENYWQSEYDGGFSHQMDIRNE